MAKLFALMHTSFDGFAAGPNGEMNWIHHDGKVFEHVSKFIAKMGVGVYGPVTFGMMESFWPAALKNPGSSETELQHAKWYQGAKKIVCSRSLRSLENKSAVLVSDLDREFRGLKEQSKEDMMIFGSPRLTQSLAGLGLIDEYLVNVNPILLGGGIRMFERLPTTKLILESATQLSGGVVGFHYKLAPFPVDD